MSWFFLQPYGTLTLTESYVRNLYAPLIDRLKAINIIPSEDNGTWSYPILWYNTVFSLGNRPYRLGFGLTTNTPYMPYISLQHQGGANSNYVISGNGLPTQLSLYVDNKAILIGAYINTNMYIAPIVIWWEDAPKNIGNNVFTGPVYMAQLANGGGVSTGVLVNDVPAVSNVIVSGQIVIPALSLPNSQNVGANETGISFPLRKGTILIRPGYTEVVELPINVHYVYSTQGLTSAEPIPGYFNINGSTNGGRWFALVEYGI